MAKLSTQIIMAWPWLKSLKIHLNGESYYSWSITEIDGGFLVYLLSFQIFFLQIMIFAHIQPQTSMFTRFSGIFRIQIALFLHRMWRSSWMCWIKLHRLEVCILTEEIKICESKCKGMNVAATEHRRQHSFTATQALFQKELIENEREMLDRMMNEWMNKYIHTNGDRQRKENTNHFGIFDVLICA